MRLSHRHSSTSHHQTRRRLQTAVYLSANVSHSGQANSSTAGNYRPLEEMESQASELYDAQLQDYEQDDDNDAKPPVRQRRLLNNVTSSTKIRLHGQNPRSLSTLTNW